MASDYNMTFLYGFMEPEGGASLSLSVSPKFDLVITKERCFQKAFSDTTPVIVKDGVHKPKCDADRTYLHYIIDCWLDDKPVELQPSELA